MTTNIPTADAQIGVVLVDDHRLFREGVASLLGRAEDITLVGEASSGVAAVPLVEHVLPARLPGPTSPAAAVSVPAAARTAAKDERTDQGEDQEVGGFPVAVGSAQAEGRDRHAHGRGVGRGWRQVERQRAGRDEDFGPTPEIMQGNIRKVFESVLKTKYYLALAAGIKAKKGLAKLLETLFEQGLLDTTLKANLFDLCSVTSGPHHGEIVDAPSKKLTRSELVPLIGEALVLLNKV